MSYLVLARKYRPQTFDTIVGQEFISRALVNAILRGRVPHALLFTGPRGVGKTTSARVFARALNCLKIPGPEALAQLPEEEARNQVEPCGECTNCTDISRGSSLAVWEIDGASNNSVENVRSLIESLRSQPPPGYRYKVYIIDEVHMLSTAAFNALLKSLEEPPPNTVFIFATTDPQKVPETVISRCQRYDFRRLATASVVAQLKEITSREGVEVPDDVLTLIARKSAGGMRDAQSMLDRLFSLSRSDISLATAERLFGFVDHRTLFQLASHVVGHRPAECFTLLDDTFQQSIDIRSFASDFLTFWRNLLMFGFAQSAEAKADLQLRLELTSEEAEEFGRIAAQTNSFDLQRLFDLAQRSVDTALASNYPRLVFEAGVAKMASLPNLRPLGEILAKLEGAELGPSRGNGGEKSPPQRAAYQAKEPQQQTAGQPVAVEPTWVDFVNFVKGQCEPVLAAYLRRVTAKTFRSGAVHLEANPFDVSALQESGARESLVRCLNAYFGETKWDIQIAAQTQPPTAPRPQQSLERKVERNVEPKREVLAGSIAALEVEVPRELKERVDREAREDPLIQSALETFGGSTIERVSVLSDVKSKRL